jgi:hypothetical protein
MRINLWHGYGKSLVDSNDIDNNNVFKTLLYTFFNKNANDISDFRFSRQLRVQIVCDLLGFDTVDS